MEFGNILCLNILLLLFILLKTLFWLFICTIINIVVITFILCALNEKRVDKIFIYTKEKILKLPNLFIKIIFPIYFLTIIWKTLIIVLFKTK